MLERRLAIPGALGVALAFHAWPTGHWLQRTFLSMIVHEVGHAVTAWFCGFAAIPTVWKTLIPDERGVLVPLVLAAGEAAMLVIGWRSQRMWLAFLGIALAIAQFIGTAAISVDRAHEWITFGGDAGAMVLGTLLMASFYVPRFAAGGLRWGLLAIGAAAFVDTFATWWSRDIPIGEIEGVGLSDPAKLIEDHGWTQPEMISRYLTLGVACLIALACVYVWQLLPSNFRPKAEVAGDRDDGSRG